MSRSESLSPSDVTGREGLPLPVYFAVALVSGAIIAYELFVMRVFANGGWSHFGSTVISIAMFGFGVFSTILCIWKKVFSKYADIWLDVALLCFGPAMLGANVLAQRLAFNPIFLVSDPDQKFALASYFLYYFVPFLFGAMFLGLIFVKGASSFGKVYFANMAGSGLGGMVLFGAMYLFLPERLFFAPVFLWALGSLLWFLSQGKKALAMVLGVSATAALAIGLIFPQINVSPYKGVSYARNFPDSKRVYQDASPFGNVEVFSSSYFHFAPGLSDTASLSLKELPENAYLGMYIDGEGPIGIMKRLKGEETEYIRYLPVALPYLLKASPEVFVMQFGGGISTNAALTLGAKDVVVAEGNPMVVKAVRDDKTIAAFTGNILRDPKVKLIEEEGRIFIARGKSASPGGKGFDLVDLSLADSTGLSSPGGSSTYEKYTYTKETFLSGMGALKADGMFAVTVWNKEDPPKSAIKLLSTMVQAAKDPRYSKNGSKDGSKDGDVRRDFFVCHTYLSTLTVLYKKGGFTPAEVTTLTEHCRKLSFELIYTPDMPPAPPGDDNLDKVFEGYKDAYFAPEKNENVTDDVDMSAGRLFRLVMARFIKGDFTSVEKGYIFNVEPLTNDRPYFAGFVKTSDFAKFSDRLESISDEWGYLLLWATLATSIGLGVLLLLLPLIFGWKAFSRGHRGKFGIIVYFLCLGLGYMLVEIGMISKYILCLGNPTVSVAVLITGMLLFSGLGSFLSGKAAARAGLWMPIICLVIAAMLGCYTLVLDRVFLAIAAWPYGLKVLACLLMLAPPAFLMGFPFAVGMGTLADLKKEQFFVWAWGINGSFSTVGSVLSPILAVTLGILPLLGIAAVLYALALPAFFHLRVPDRPGAGTL